MLEHSDRKIALATDHGGSLMIKRINIREIPFNKVFLGCREDLIIDDKDLLFFSFLGIITIFYLIEEDSCLNPKGFFLGRRPAVRLGC